MISVVNSHVGRTSFPAVMDQTVSFRVRPDSYGEFLDVGLAVGGGTAMVGYLGSRWSH